MKKFFTPVQCFCALVLMITIQSCQSKYDSKGRLLADYLVPASGKLHFTPMLRSDSASVREFKPDTLYFNGKPYTGGIAAYDKRELIELEGFATNGLMDSTWKFYFASGGVRIKGTYKDGRDIGLWRSYYGYDKPKVDKLYDENGYMLMRAEYFDNGHIKEYQNIKHPLFDNKERSISLSSHGDIISIYVEDSVLMLKQGDKTERIGKNVFAEKRASSMPVVK
ncbi:MAG: hypothetical protein JWO06_1325 [Bacteroidota bacterium]|nr:hypothetical protein [Bacteroidota bacterium]